MFRYIALVALLAVTAQQGAAIKCFQCTSKTHDACKDPMMMSNSTTSGSLMATECVPRLAWTTKSLNDILPGSVTKLLEGTGLGNIGSSSVNSEMVCLKLNIKAGEEVVTTRHCTFAIPPSDSSAPKGSGVCELAKQQAGGKDEFCGVCDMDGCNSARQLTVKSVLIWAPLLLALFFKP